MLLLVAQSPTPSDVAPVPALPPFVPPTPKQALETIIPPLIYVFGTFFFLQSLGIDLTGLWVAFGGITFVLGFALKDILANFFSGLVLLIDTPFQFDDMVYDSILRGQYQAGTLVSWQPRDE